MGPGESEGIRLRWRRADQPTPPGQPNQGELFAPPEPRWRTGHGEFRDMEFLHVAARSIINEVPAPARVPFRYTINVYRGCSHACTYCFARPTHAYLGLGIDSDFERRIVVKVNAVELLRAELSARRWAGSAIAMGTNTDPYQRCEGRYRLTQGVIEVLAEARNPFSVLTKSTLILRDLDLLTAAATTTDLSVNLSIGTLDESVWRLTEPGTPAPRLRIETVRRLNAAGIRCGVLLAPVLPGLSDGPEQVSAVVTAALDAGATSVRPVALHLRPGVREHYLAWLGGARPDLLPEHQRRYGRPYLPTGDQRALADLVDQLVRGHRGGGAGRDQRQPELTPAPDRSAAETTGRADPAGPAGTRGDNQLRLSL